MGGAAIVLAALIGYLVGHVTTHDPMTTSGVLILLLMMLLSARARALTLARLDAMGAAIRDRDGLRVGADVIEEVGARHRDSGE